MKYLDGIWGEYASFIKQNKSFIKYSLSCTVCFYLGVSSETKNYYFLSEGGISKKYKYLAVKERVTIEVYVSIINTLSTKSISDPLACHASSHQWHDIPDPSGQLEHDDNKTDGHPRDPTQHSSCSYHSIKTRCDATFILNSKWRTDFKEHFV